MQNKGLFDDNIEFSQQTDLSQATLALPAGAGLCLFTAEKNRPIVLLQGANVRLLARRRLAKDKTDGPSRRVKLRGVTKKIWFRRCYSPFETQLAYFHVAREIYPDTYHELFSHLKTWFIQVNRQYAYPFFAMTNNYQPPGQEYWGPFAEKQAANKCLEILQDIFGLCRNPQSLRQAPNATPCQYAQMDRCATVCNGTFAKKDYYNLIKRAIDFMNHHPADNLKILHAKMKLHATALAFEKAQKIKDQISLIEKLPTTPTRWVRPMRQFHVLIFQQGPPIKLPDQRAAKQSITPFLVGPGWIHQIEPFLLSQADQACKSIIDHVHLAKMQQIHQENTTRQQDMLAWTANYLYKSSRDKGLFMRADDQLNYNDLARKIAAHFEKLQKKPKPSAKLKLDSLSLAAQPDETEEKHATDNN